MPGKGFFVSKGDAPGRALLFQVRWLMRILLLLMTILSLAWGPRISTARADDPVGDAIALAISWLHTRQLADASFGGASVTADAVYALALAGEDPAGPSWSKNSVSALDALEAQAAGYATRGAGEAGKVLRAVALAGGNPRNFAGLDLIAEIEQYYDPATGRYHPTYLFRHSLAVEGLARAGHPVPARAFDAILAAQIPDGSWFWTFSGTTGDVDTTGRVLAVTAGLGGPRCSSAYDRAVAYLATAQKPDGGWGVYPPPDANPANANSTALTLAGLRALGVPPDDPRFIRQGRTPLETLLAFQETSGAFVYIRQPGFEESRLMATIEAVAALSQPQTLPATCYPTYLPLIARPG